MLVRKKLCFNMVSNGSNQLQDAKCNSALYPVVDYFSLKALL